MLFKALDLTTALRPSLLPDETLLFVQDAVGLYEGKFKVPNYQNGHAYLTSHRICYVAAEEPRKYSVSIDLRDVERVEYQAGFLMKSSPKIVIYPKPQKRGIGSSHSTRPTSPLVGSASLTSPQASSPSPAPQLVPVTWVCPICSFSNPVPSNFDPATANASTPLPPCLACGIKPELTTILKAAIAAASQRSNGPAPPPESSAKDGEQSAAIACPRCTFNNHPSLIECEICGASLVAVTRTDTESRSESPAPMFGQSMISNKEISDNIKLSFRGGGEKIFFERLKNALIQRKWLLNNAPPIPAPAQSARGDSASPARTEPSPRPTAVGIAGLEQRGLESRKNNERMIGNAFEDLEALMASAKEIVALAESLAKESGLAQNREANDILTQSAAALGMVTTRDMLDRSSSSSTETLYLSELSRNLAEFLTDDRTGILRREGGIMSLIDLWAVFNRTRNGVELVSPADFHRAAQLWETLKLPVRLRRFKSGLLVVQRWDWSDEKILQQLRSWLERIRSYPPPSPSDDHPAVPWDWARYGRGVTAHEAAREFGWSVGVAAEELEMAEDRGLLCREEGIEGVRFWLNPLLDSNAVIS
ncbi:hypothetical protein VTN31DRAFT_4174 [Thermomyces dupontii]|uniref:uncharacterized protein n=1 Tax=Talaromyces thermophilus TaxID=28565 RepID=UPI0037441E33